MISVCLKKELEEEVGYILIVIGYVELTYTTTFIRESCESRSCLVREGSDVRGGSWLVLGVGVGLITCNYNEVMLALN